MTPTYAWIWPKDPRPGNPRHWPRHWRLLDVLTNRGPDIFVEKINEPPQKRCKRANGRCSAWNKNQCRYHHGCCGGCRGTGESSVPWTKRGLNEIYDFRTRKYAIPDLGSWRGVEYYDGGRPGDKSHLIPKRIWDCNGREYPAHYWQQAIHRVQAGGYCRRH